MKKSIYITLILFFTIQLGWAQKTEILPDLKKKVEITSENMRAFECNELDPLSLNATLVWSNDKTQLAVIMKTNLLYGWHIYSYVPKSQPYVGTEFKLELPKGISKIGKLIKPLDEAYDDGVFIYNGQQVFVQYCSVKNFKKGDIIKSGLFYQTCDLNKCYPPETKTRKLVL